MSSIHAYPNLLLVHVLHRSGLHTSIYGHAWSIWSVYTSGSVSRLLSWKPPSKDILDIATSEPCYCFLTVLIKSLRKFSVALSSGISHKFFERCSMFLLLLFLWFRRYLIRSSSFRIALPCLLFLEWTAQSSFVSLAFKDQGLGNFAFWTMDSWNSCFDIATLPYRSRDVLMPQVHRLDKEGSSNSPSWLACHVSFWSPSFCFCCSFLLSHYWMLSSSSYSLFASSFVW